MTNEEIKEKCELYGLDFNKYTIQNCDQAEIHRRIHALRNQIQVKLMGQVRYVGVEDF